LTAQANHLTIRPIAGPAELGLFTRLPYSLNSQLARDLAAGARRPEWMWVALRGDRLLARAAWWGRGGSGVPSLLDILDIDDGPAGDTAAAVAAAARLLEAAMAAVLPAGAVPPEYLRAVPADWRERPRSRRAVEDRMRAAEMTGARLLVERLQLEWLPGTPLAAPSARLGFRPVRGQRELVALMTLVMAGTLDAHGRDDLARMSHGRAAAKHYTGELVRYESPHDWWRIAVLPGGEPVGFVIPAHNGCHPIIAYIGVVPAHRGNGYIDELLAEGTRILAAQGVPRIRASTDLGNIPMASAFRRAGWAVLEHEIDMTWRVAR